MKKENEITVKLTKELGRGFSFVASQQRIKIGEEYYYPYILKVNGKLVRIRFSGINKTAEDCLTRVLENLYR